MENHYHSEHDNEASESSKPGNLELIFPSRVASPMYTGRRITGEVHGGTECIKIMLIDSQTRQQVISEIVSSLKVKMVLIRGDFDGVTTGNSNIWTHEEFKEKIVVTWENKKNLLLGNLSLVLKNGIGTVGEMRIKHDNKPLKNVKFRLGAMVDDDKCPFRIKEAITNLFEVKDRRNESKYLGPLSPNDWVWQLVNISKKGPIRKRLESKKVSTVKDFLNMHSSNPQVLQQVCGFKGKKWQKTVDHAKTCLLKTMCDANELVIRSSFQQSNTVPSFNYSGSIDFDNNCYKPQPCEDDLFDNKMIVDRNFSIQDVEVCDVCIFVFEPRRDGLEGASTSVHNGAKGKGDLAKKRWMRLRATIWFWMVSFMKKVGSCVCSP